MCLELSGRQKLVRGTPVSDQKADSTVSKTRGVPGSSKVGPGHPFDIDGVGSTDEEVTENLDEIVLPKGDETLPWRRRRRRQGTESATLWHRASRDRSLESKPTEDEGFPGAPKSVLPWTQEDVKLKRTPREKREPQTEHLEDVHLKPTKVDKKEIAREKLEDVDLKPMKRQLRDQERAENIVLKPVQKGKPHPDETEGIKPVKEGHPEVPVTSEQIPKKEATHRTRDTLLHLTEQEDSIMLDITNTEEEVGRRTFHDQEGKGITPKVADLTRPIPWTQEAVKLKKAPREVKEPQTEKLETVQLKPTKTEKKVIPKEELEQVDLKPVTKEEHYIDQLDSVTLKPVKQEVTKPEETEKNLVPAPEDSTYWRSEEEDTTLLQIGRSVAETQLKRKVKERPQSVLRKTEEYDSSFLKVDDSVEEKEVREDKVSSMKTGQEEAQKSGPLPWTQEAVKLKRTLVQRKELQREMLENVELKPTKRDMKELPKEELERVDLQPISLGPQEPKKPEGVTLHPVERDAVAPSGAAEVTWKAPHPNKIKSDKSGVTVRKDQDGLITRKDEEDITVLQIESTQDTTLKTKEMLERVRKEEDSSLLIIEDTNREQHTAPWRVQEDKSRILSKTKVKEGIEVPRQVPWTKEITVLRKAPREKKEPQSSQLDEVQLKPVKKPSKIETLSDTDVIQKLGPEESRTLKVIQGMEQDQLSKVPWQEVEDDTMIKSRTLQEEVESIAAVDTELVPVQLPAQEQPKEDEPFMKSELPWHRDDKPVQDTVLEFKSEVPWRRGKKPREEETKSEKVTLKPVRKEIPNQLEKKETVELKPVTKDSPHSQQPDEVVLKEEIEGGKDDIQHKPFKPVSGMKVPDKEAKPVPSMVTEEKPEEEKVPYKSELPWSRGKKAVKKVPKPEVATLTPIEKEVTKDVEQVEKVELKPIPSERPQSVKPEEERVTPIKQTQSPVDEKEREVVTVQPVSRKEKLVGENEDIKLKPVPRKEKPEEEKEEVKLKPIPRKEKPVEEKEDISLKPIPRKEKLEEEKEDVKLKPIPRKEKPEEDKEDVKLKPIPRKEKPEEEKEDVSLKTIPRKEKPGEEKKERVIPWRKKVAQEKEEVELQHVLKEDKLTENVHDVQQPTLPAVVKEEKEVEEEMPDKSAVPWRRARKPVKPVQEVPQPEVVTLKPTKKEVTTIVEQVEKVELKPIPGERPQSVKPEDETVERVIRTERQVDEKEGEVVVLQPISRKEKPVEENEDIILKPAPRKEKPEEVKEEVKLKPVPKKKKPEEEKEEVKLKPIPRKEKPEEEEEEIKLKPVPRKEKPEEEKEEVKLKPVSRKEKPEEEKEEVKLKPVPKKEKPEEEKEDVKLKPVPIKEKPEEEKEEVKLKPIPRKEKPEEEKEEVKLKPVPRKEKPEEEKEDIKLKTVSKKEQIMLKTEQEKEKVRVEPVSKGKPEPMQLKDESNFEEEKLPEETNIPLHSKEAKEPQPQPVSVIEKPKEIPGAVKVTDQMKPVDTREEKTVAPWRRKRAGKPEDITPVPICEESKPELKPVQVEDEGEEYNEEKKSKTQISFSTVQKKVSLRQKPELQSEENQEVVEVRETLQKEMRMDAVSKKKVTQDERISVTESDDRPLRELEIITAKRVTEGVIRIPEEPVVEDVEVHEERHTVKQSLLRETKTIPPYFIQRLQPVAAEPNKTALFTCQVDGYPFPELTWYRNGVEIQPTSRTVFKVFESTATLEISSVTPDDVGNYTCQASNPAGIATSTANLLVIGTCWCVACSRVAHDFAFA